MSMSTQLVRGTLALPMLLLFALLGVLASQSARQHPLPVAQASVTAPVCTAPPRPLLMLAQAPADLGPMAARQGQGCRA